MNNLYKIQQEFHDIEFKRKELHNSFGNLCWKCKTNIKPLNPPCVYCDECRHKIIKGEEKSIFL